MRTKSSSFLCESRRPVYSLFSRLLAFASHDEMAEMTIAGIPYDLSCDALFENADRQVLLSIACSAHTLQRTLHLGTAAMGTCTALASPEAMDGDQCSPATVEAIGWLLAELADLMAICHHLEASANRTLLAREPP